MAIPRSRVLDLAKVCLISRVERFVHSSFWQLEGPMSNLFVELQPRTSSAWKQNSASTTKGTSCCGILPQENGVISGFAKCVSSPWIGDVGWLSGGAGRSTADVGSPKWIAFLTWLTIDWSAKLRGKGPPKKKSTAAGMATLPCLFQLRIDLLQNQSQPRRENNHYSFPGANFA